MKEKLFFTSSGSMVGDDSRAAGGRTGGSGYKIFNEYH
jgi:hypothetical protein